MRVAMDHGGWEKRPHVAGGSDTCRRWGVGRDPAGAGLAVEVASPFRLVLPMTVVGRVVAWKVPTGQVSSEAEMWPKGGGGLKCHIPDNSLLVGQLEDTDHGQDAIPTVKADIDLDADRSRWTLAGGNGRGGRSPLPTLDL